MDCHPAASIKTKRKTSRKAKRRTAACNDHSDVTTHFEALIVSDAFRGLSRLARHRLVYAALGDRMRAEIHALSMTTITPEEHAAAR